MTASEETERLRALAAAEAVRGSLLFHLRLAEALAGEALKGRACADVVGWAVDIGPDGYEVAALGGPDGGDVLHRVTFAADGAPLVETAPGTPSTARQRLLATAREAGAAIAGAERCASVVTPPLRDGRRAAEVEVHLVRLADGPGLVLGPHRRLWIDAETGRVLQVEPLRASEPLAAAPGSAAAVVLAQAEGPVPSATQVLSSLEHGTALDVVTVVNGRRWRVDGEVVTLRGDASATS